MVEIFKTIKPPKPTKKTSILSFDPQTGECNLKGVGGRIPDCPIRAKIAEIVKDPQKSEKSGLLNACKECETSIEIPEMLSKIPANRLFP